MKYKKKVEYKSKPRSQLYATPLFLLLKTNCSPHPVHRPIFSLILFRRFSVCAIRNRGKNFHWISSNHVRDKWWIIIVVNFEWPRAGPGNKTVKALFRKTKEIVSWVIVVRAHGSLYYCSHPLSNCGFSGFHKKAIQNVPKFISR